MDRNKKRALHARMMAWAACILASLCWHPATAAIAYVQSNNNAIWGAANTISVTYSNAQTAGNFNVVVIGNNSASGGIQSLTDSRGNVYTLAIGPTRANMDSQWIYYAKNIGAAAAGSNTVTVTYNANVDFTDVRIAEYSGIDTVNPLDGTSAGSGVSATSSSGAVVTTNANDLLVAGTTTQSYASSAGSGFTVRQISGLGYMLQDRIVTSAGSYTATSNLDWSEEWVTQVAAFKAASGSSDSQAPTTPANLAATAASATQINLSWTASTDNVGVTNYLIERCQGAGCSNFAQVTTSTMTSYSNIGLTASTSYSYRVRATDAASNLSGYSSTASATTSAAPDTQAPTTPTSVTASAISSSQINLSWTASTDNVGVTGYRVEQCQGTSCVNFAEIATPTTTTYSSTGLGAATSYSYRVRATDAVGNLSGYSSTASATTQAPADTQAPTTPLGLTATSISSTHINLSWTASTDNVGVTGYRVERCSGASCTTFAQIGTPTSISHGDGGLAALTSYSYRVRAIDAAGNLSGYSTTTSAVTSGSSGSATITYVQSNNNAIWGAANTISVTYSNAQTAGNFNVVVIGNNSASGGIQSLTDSRGNVYTLAIGPTRANMDSQWIYYAKNIGAAAAGSNTVTVTYNANVDFTDVRIAEYSGIDTVNPLDGTSAGSGVSATSSSGAVVTTNANDLLVAGTTTQSYASSAGSGFTVRQIGGLGYMLQDRIVTSAGSYTATSNLDWSEEWVTQVAAFKAASGSSDSQAPTVPSSVTATPASATQINLAWTASTDNVGVTNYLIERCQGSSCSSFAQVATSATPSYSNTGLSTSTSYSYRLRATDAAGNLSAYSGIVTATTSAAADTQAPTTPGNFFVEPTSSTQINLGWTASTDNVGVTGYRIERCAGASCTTFAEIATSTSTTYSNTGLTPSTTYRYRIRATDAAGNLSSYSAIAAGNTYDTPDTQAPTIPTGLSATVVSATQLNLSWTASTDNVGVTGYRVERCQGASCTTFAEIATPTTTTYSNTGLTAATTYRYRVRAVDAAGNLSSYSSIVTATTTTLPTTPTGLSVTATSRTEIDLAWSPATSAVGIAGYRLERCQGTGCSSFTQIAAPTLTVYYDMSLTAATSYNYRVRAIDSGGNLSSYSSALTVVTLPAGTGCD